MKRLDETWRKSSRSDANGSCVEVRYSNDKIEVRDTKNRQGGSLTFTAAEWEAFTGGVKDLEFDLPNA